MINVLGFLNLKNISIQTSHNPKYFYATKSIKIENPLERDDQTRENKFKFPMSNQKECQKVRFSIKNPGLCPDWHLGAGNKSWVFIDEISFE